MSDKSEKLVIDISNREVVKKLIKVKDQRLSFEPQKGKSDVWNRFNRIYFNGNATIFVKCKTCDDFQKYDKNSGTGGLSRHKCPIDSNQQTIDKAFKNYGSQKSQISKAAVTCATKDLLPFSFIEGEGFEYLAKELIKIGANCGQFVDIKKLLPKNLVIQYQIMLTLNILI